MSQPVVSFCATNLETASTLPHSLESIETIGQRWGEPFEVIVADGPSSPDVQAWLAQWEAAGPNRIVVRHTERKRGYGRRRAFEASHGDIIVPFDTSIVYAPSYASLLAAYSRMGTERMLFSEICALRRSTIMAVGGWRDLIGGEDLDLYAPVVERFGLIAYPTGDPTTQSRVLSSFARQMRYAKGSKLRRVYRMFQTQRDQIIGANYRVSDLMAFNRAKPVGVRAGARLWFTAASAAAALSPLPRRKVDGTNNYRYFREQMIDSLLRRDYAALGWSEGPRPRLPLTRDEMLYLDQTSECWRRARRANPELFVEKV